MFAVQLSDVVMVSDVSQGVQSAEVPPTVTDPRPPAALVDSATGLHCATEVILQDIKTACDQIASISLEGLGTLDDFADLVASVREASAVQEVACAIWGNELAEMNERALSIGETIHNVSKQLELPTDYTKVLVEMKKTFQISLVLKSKLSKFHEVSGYSETLKEFETISFHFANLRQNFSEIQINYQKLACARTRAQRSPTGPNSRPPCPRPRTDPNSRPPGRGLRTGPRPRASRPRRSRR